MVQSDSQDGSDIAIIGCGGWGTALSLLLEAIGHRVTIWGVDPDYVDQMRESRRNPRYLPEVDIPSGIGLSAQMEDCVPSADVVVMATPTIYLRDVCESVEPHLDRGSLVVNVAKGIEEETLMVGTDVVKDVCGQDLKIAGLFGPSHAEEVARGQPTTVVAASERPELARRVQDLFMCPTFRVYTNRDLIGVELGAALKNVIAIAAGICDGLDYGDNAKSALLTRGLAEISRLGEAMGARRRTFSGLTGLGDLITTCVSPFGRNRSVGERIAKGESLDEVVDEMDMVAEGVRTVRSGCELASLHGVDMPIFREVYAVLFGGKDPREAGRELMQRAPRPEHDRALAEEEPEN